MESLRIVLLALAAAITFGVLHDQVTARVCVEYFTIGHPKIIESTSPTILALAWGVVATWWVGLPLGGLLAIAARAGSWPKLTAAELVRPVLCLLAVMALAAATFGATGYFLAKSGAVFITGTIAERVPLNRHVAFLSDLWAHSASYFFGAVGGVVVVLLTFRRRERMRVMANMQAR